MPSVPTFRPGPVALAAVAALAMGAVPAGAVTPAGQAAPRLPARSAHLPSSHTVTLITGDKVTVNTAADGKVTRAVQGADGKPTDVTMYTTGGNTYAYPAAALGTSR